MRRLGQPLRTKMPVDWKLEKKWGSIVIHHHLHQSMDISDMPVVCVQHYTYDINYRHSLSQLQHEPVFELVRVLVPNLSQQPTDRALQQHAITPKLLSSQMVDKTVRTRDKQQVPTPG